MALTFSRLTRAAPTLIVTNSALAVSMFRVVDFAYIIHVLLSHNAM